MNPTHAQEYQTVPTPPRRPRTAGRIVLLLVAVAASCGLGVVTGVIAASPQAPSSSAAAAEPASVASSTHAAKAPAAAKSPTYVAISGGTWSVGIDFPAGTYRVTANVGSDCYWSITKTGTNGSEIIENGIPGGGRPTVTLKKGQDFETQRCGVWHKVK